jgi:hypothetical protein
MMQNPFNGIERAILLGVGIPSYLFGSRIHSMELKGLLGVRPLDYDSLRNPFNGIESYLGSLEFLKPYWRESIQWN